MTTEKVKGENNMYRPFIITPQSFVSKSYDKLMKIIPFLNSGDVEYKVFFFCKPLQFAQIVDVEDNYKAIVKALEENNIEYSELPVYEWDELFHLLSTSKRFEKEIGYNGELYCSPTNASYYISVSAGTVGYNGKLKFVLNFNEYTGKIFFKDSDYEKLAKNPRWSTVGLDKTKIEYAKIADYSECYYEIDGKTYHEKPLNKDNCSDKGTQGYSYVSSKSGYRLKFWDYPGFYYGFQIDKLKKMISDLSPDNMAVPKAIIYSKNNIAIGIVMDNFNGIEVPFEKYSELPNFPLKFMESLMKGLINAEAYSYIHRDFHHNILFDDTNYQAYIIDLDSVQYANYPPTAQSAENRSCLPAKYTIRGRYFSTVELSYWAVMMAMSSIIVPNPRRGTCVIEKGTEKGLYKLNEKRYEELRQKAPHIADVALRQYDECFPCHPMRLMEAIIRDKDKLDFKSVFANLKVYLTDEVIPEPTEDDYLRDDYGDYIATGNCEKYTADKATKSETKIYQDVILDEDDTPKQSFPRPASDNAKVNPNPNPVPIVTAKKKKAIKDNKVIALLYKWYKMIVVKLFMRSLGTASVAFDTSIPEEELYEKQYKLFIAKKMWKKPLIASIVMVVISIGLIIAANLI